MACLRLDCLFTCLFASGFIVPSAGVTDADQVEVTETEVVGKRLVNKFNFAERDVQTFNLPMKDREQQTDVPGMLRP